MLQKQVKMCKCFVPRLCYLCYSPLVFSAEPQMRPGILLITQPQEGCLRDTLHYLWLPKVVLSVAPSRKLGQGGQKRTKLIFKGGRREAPFHKESFLAMHSFLLFLPPPHTHPIAHPSAGLMCRQLC